RIGARNFLRIADCRFRHESLSPLPNLRDGHCCLWSLTSLLPCMRWSSPVATPALSLARQAGMPVLPDRDVASVNESGRPVDDHTLAAANAGQRQLLTLGPRYLDCTPLHMVPLEDVHVV